MKYQKTTTKRLFSGTSLLAFSVFVAGCGVDETKVKNAYLAGYLEGADQVPFSIFLGYDEETLIEEDIREHHLEDLWAEVSCADRHEMLVANCAPSGLDLLNTTRVAAYDQGLADGCGLAGEAEETGINFVCNLNVDRDRQGERGAGYNWWTTADSPETCDEVSLYLGVCSAMSEFGRLYKDW